jgi:cysteine-rich repeat protein
MVKGGMRMRNRLVQLTGGFLALLALTMCGLVRNARAEEQSAFHFMSIVEVFPGTVSAPNAQYIVLQMYFAGQNLVGGQQVNVYNAAGGVIATYTFPGNVANGANQASILIATAQAVALFGVTADLTMTSASIPLAGGKICFGADPFTIDCISWGNYTGSTVGVGNPFAYCVGGLKTGQAVRRKLNICGGAGTLESCDDTQNSANDFFFTLPALRNNANVAGTIPPSTCGNGATEGLEDCDDANGAPGDGCFNCQFEPPPCANTVGDLNGDAIYTSSDVVQLTNCAFLGLGICDLCFTDVNRDVSLTSSDVVLEINRAFLGTVAFPWCGQ